MPCEEQMVQTLKEYGHRPTPQRLMIMFRGQTFG